MSIVNLDPQAMMILKFISEDKTIREMRNEVDLGAISMIHSRIEKLIEYGLVAKQGQGRSVKRMLTPLGAETLKFSMKGDTNVRDNITGSTK